jgi:hypothetical protein
LNQVYLDTARLLSQVAPLVFANNVFALKGGTAINLFVFTRTFGMSRADTRALSRA